MHHGDTEIRRVDWGQTERILGACIEVHRHLGPGLLESTYEICLAAELQIRGIKFERQVPLPVRYKGVELDAGYRLDFVVEDDIVLELESVAELLPIHTAQVLTYLTLSRRPIGLLVNLNVSSLRRGGIRRLIRGEVTGRR